MNDTVSTIIITAVTSIVTGLSTWFFTRRKYNAEVDGSKIENLQKSLDFYVQLSDDTNKRLTEILKNNETFELKVAELKTENAELKELVEKQNEQIETLTSQIEQLNSTISRLSKRN